LADIGREANDSATVENHSVGFASRSNQNTGDCSADAHVALRPAAWRERRRRHVDDGLTGRSVRDAPGPDLASRTVLKAHALDGNLVTLPDHGKQARR